MGKDPVNDEQAAAAEAAENARWVEYKKTHDPKLREAFVIQYRPLVKHVAGKVAIGMPHSVEFDDLVEFGTMGLLDAIDKYDPERKVKFKTYAMVRIRGSIFDELRAIDWVPRSIRGLARELEGARANLEAQLGRTATDAEVARKMGISEAEYNKLIMKVSGTSIMSLDDVWYTGDENDKVSIGDTVESPTSLNPDDEVMRKEIRSVINESIKELPDKERKVLVLYYYEDMTLKEIGKILEVTESRVSQLHTRAILHLRSKLTNARRGIA
jgi:RNA polymerase sigma factor for flagellar operon FliA